MGRVGEKRKMGLVEGRGLVGGEMSGLRGGRRGVGGEEWGGV